MKNYLKNEKENEKILLSPKIDVVFQALFGEIGSEKITSKFLETILQEKINVVDLSKNLILRRDYVNDKMGILDIIARVNDNEYCNIELQVSEQDKILERILYYWGRVYTKQLKSGKDYDTLQKTVVILIANFNVEGLENLEYHTTWKIIEEKYRTTILTEKLEIHIIEIPKIDGNSNEDDELIDWIMFLDNPHNERVKRKMKENNELREANEKLEGLSNDERMIRLAELREKAIYEENTAINHAMKKGIQQGMQQGIQQGVKESKEEIAIKLLKENVDIELICKVTSLTKEEIENIRNKT